MCVVYDALWFEKGRNRPALWHQHCQVERLRSQRNGLARASLRRVARPEDHACPAQHAGYRFPAEIIRFAVRLYFRFPLILRHVEERSLCSWRCQVEEHSAENEVSLTSTNRY
jgi:hypothetical protein